MDATLRRHKLLLAIALIFHAVGLGGIAIFQSTLIMRSTPMHLSLMALLLLVSFAGQLRRFAIWAAITAVVSFWAEWVGVHTGMLFGHYEYGTVLGPRLLDIPLLIGLNWVVVVAGACSIAARLKGPAWLQIIVAAGLATGYDWIMEPVAIRLHYWTWLSREIPALNYACWALFAGLFAGLWQMLRIRGNIFAAGLFVIQLIFFVLLRTLL